MASTNKTPNIGLNQWVLSDPFLMEDMNADNQIIDSAIAANPYAKLMDITTIANAQQIDLDVSGIDFTEFTSLTLNISSQATPIGVATYFYVKMNNGGDLIRSITASTWTSVNYVGANLTNNRYNTTSDYDAVTKLEIIGLPQNLTNPYVTHIRTTGVGWYNGKQLTEYNALKSFSANEQISSFSFLTDNSSAYIKAGTRFELYGVRR